MNLATPCTDPFEDAFLRLAINMPLVLLHGASGSGKTWTAKRLHALRRQGEYVAVNVGSLPDDVTMARSALFGHVKGAFTGALNESSGYLGRLRNGGTLFLDEFERASPAVAELLIDLLDTNPNASLYRVGASTPTPRPDFKVIIATKVPLAATPLRPDLRMRVVCGAYCIDLSKNFESSLPWFIERHAHKLGVRLEEGLVPVLCRSQWPGLLREVEGVLAVAACLLAQGGHGTIVTAGLIERIRTPQRCHLAGNGHPPLVEGAPSARRPHPGDARLLSDLDAAGSISALAKSYGRARGTIRKWVKAAKAAGGGSNCSGMVSSRTK